MNQEARAKFVRDLIAEEEDELDSRITAALLDAVNNGLITIDIETGIATLTEKGHIWAEQMKEHLP